MTRGGGVLTTANGVGTTPSCCCGPTDCGCVGGEPTYINATISGGPAGTDWYETFVAHAPSAQFGTWQCIGQRVSRSRTRIYGSLNGQHLLRRVAASPAAPCCYRSESWVFAIERTDIDIVTDLPTGYSERREYHLIIGYGGYGATVEFLERGTFDGAPVPPLLDSEIACSASGVAIPSPTYPSAGPCNWGGGRDGRCVGGLDYGRNPPTCAGDYWPELLGMPAIGTRLAWLCGTTSAMGYGDFVADPGPPPAYNAYPYDPNDPQAPNTPCGCIPNVPLASHVGPQGAHYGGLAVDFFPVF